MLYRAVDPVEVVSGCLELEDTIPFFWSSIPSTVIKDINTDYKMSMIEMNEKCEFKEKDVLLVEEVEELEDCDISFEWKGNIIGFENDLL